MIKRSFLGFSKSYLAYDKITGPPQEPRGIPLSGQATFIVKFPLDPTLVGGVKVGKRVKTGAKLVVSGDAAGYAIASVTGRISKVSASIV